MEDQKQPKDESPPPEEAQPTQPATEPQPEQPARAPQPEAPAEAPPQPFPAARMVESAAPESAEPEGPPQPVFTPFSLTVGDGFKFGCGLSMALGIAALMGLLLFLIVALAASLAGVATPFSPR